MYSYSSLAGEWAGYAVGASVILFAFATVICQGAYGEVALKYLGDRAWARRLYLLLCAAACIAGTVIPDGFMWQAADMTVSLMTVLNVTCLAAACFGGRGKCTARPGVTVAVRGKGARGGKLTYGRGG